MEDNLIFCSRGPDEGFTELLITGTSPCITAHSKIYVTAPILLELSQEIETFLREPDLEGYWENDVPGIGGPPCVTLRFLPQDAMGHVLVEIYMELNDGGDFLTHNCRFYIHTDRTKLQAFASALENFRNPQDGASILLSGL